MAGEQATALPRRLPDAVGAAGRFCRSPRTVYGGHVHAGPAGDFSRYFHYPSSGRNCGSVAGVGVAFQNGVPFLVIYLLLLLVLGVLGWCRSNWRSLSGFAG